MDIIWIAPAGALIALLFALYNAYKVKRADQGNDKVRELSGIIKQGANAYLKRQYKTVGLFFAVVFAILLVLSFIKPEGSAEGLINKYTPFAFLTGGVFSGLSGFLGMKIATAANGRTATAAQNSLNRGLRVAFSAGSVMGFIVVGLGLLDTSLWFILLKYAFRLDPGHLSGAMITFGIGASTMALFARVGGGIFTKAADVGADLVGKVEVGIPEDDPRNPATIADNVGDNVGDVAGMGADLYESYVGSVISAIALAFGAFGAADGADNGSVFLKMTVPLILAVVGMVCSVIGTFFVRCGTSTDQKKLLGALRRGTYIAAGLFAAAAFPVVYFMLGKENVSVYGAVVSGLLAGVLIGYFTEYFTSDTYKPTRKLAKSSETGPATIIISGLSLGMRSVIAPVIIIAISIIASFKLSGGDLGENMAKGLFGIAISAVGMLSTLGITLATDAYGPVADNAGGIAQMAGMDEEIRNRTDALDSLGNTTAATGKGFAIGSAALTALSLIVAFTQRIGMLDVDKKFEFRIDITNPIALVGIILGAMLPFVFAAMTMDSVGKAAQSIIGEVHRQFKEKFGILEGKEKPDYAKCVDICTKNSLKQMILPSVLAVLAPVIIGLLLGPDGITGMLCGATVSGFMLAIFMSNSGGAWDNAKKYIESGKHGGKGSEAHKAGVVGDTVGDPLKDTSGPSINILIKLLSIVSIVFAYIIMKYHLPL